MGKNDLFGTKSRRKEGVVMLKKDGKLYAHMKDMTKTERALLDYLVKEMADDLNTVVVGGPVRVALLEELGITEGSLRVLLSKLKKEGFIDKTALPNEYLVDPRLAVAGNEAAVYRNMEKLEEELKERKRNAK